MVTFRNDVRGRRALERWRAQCLEWCYDRVEDGRFADQAYLDDWPDVLEGVIVVDTPGIGLGPWNASRFVIDVKGTEPRVDGAPLVFYHFHNFKSISPHLHNDGLLGYGSMSQAARRFLYGGDIRDLMAATTVCRRRRPGQLRTWHLDRAASSGAGAHATPARPVRGWWPRLRRGVSAGLDTSPEQ